MVNTDIDLEGKVWNLPDSLYLDFCKHKVYNGQISLGNNDTIVNGFFINSNELTYRRIHYDGRILDYCIALSIIDKSDIGVFDCTFYTNQDSLKLAPTENFGIYAYGTKSKGCKNIHVENCKFDGSSCNYLSNVSKSNIKKSVFTGPKHMLSVETLYNLEHNGVYSNPSIINIEDCSFITNNSDPSEPPIWISGVDGLVFENNYCESDCHIMQLYCGDFNMGIRNVKIKDCTFSIIVKDNEKRTVCTVTCWGRSYKNWPEETKIDLDNSITFENCTFDYNNEVLDKDGVVNGVCRALNIRFIERLVVSSSMFSGYKESIGIFDSFKGVHYGVTDALINNNMFLHSQDPVSIELNNGCPNFWHLFFQNNSIQSIKGNEGFINVLSSFGNCEVADNNIF